MVTGPHLLVAVTQFQRMIRIALEVRGRRHLFKRQQREHLATHLEHDVFRSER